MFPFEFFSEHMWNPRCIAYCEKKESSMKIQNTQKEKQTRIYSNADESYLSMRMRSSRVSEWDLEENADEIYSRVYKFVYKI